MQREDKQVRGNVTHETLKHVYGVDQPVENPSVEKSRTEELQSPAVVDEESLLQMNEEQLRDLVKQLLKEREQLQRQVKEFQDLAARRAAELENFRRRVEKEKEDFVRYANEKLLLELLPFIDDLHRAVESGKQQKNYEALAQGIELIYSKVMKILQQIGVRPIETVGRQFDVELHEALMHVPHEAPEGEIVQEVERGYLYGEKVLRHAKVITSAGKKGSNAQQEEAQKAEKTDSDGEQGR